MSVNAANLIMGPAHLYVAAFGSADPADSAVTPNGPLTPPGGAWQDVGATEGGVTFEVDSTYTDLTADQILMAVGARLTDLKMSVTVKLSEITLGNIQVALNSIGTVTAGSGYSTLDIGVTAPATQPTYIALCIDGWAPELTSGAGALRRVIVRKALSQAKVTLAHDRKTQQSLDCTFNTYFVSETLKPVHIVDQQA
jgi:hypothetical protein